MKRRVIPTDVTRVEISRHLVRLLGRDRKPVRLTAEHSKVPRRPRLHHSGVPSHRR